MRNKIVAHQIIGQRLPCSNLQPKCGTQIEIETPSLVGIGYRAKEFKGYKFQEFQLKKGKRELTVYRSETGFRLFRDLCQATRLAYTAPR